MEQNPTPQIKQFKRAISLSRVWRYIRRYTKDYFFGMLLQPWIWALGYVFFTGAFILILFLKNQPILTTQQTDLPSGLTILHVWVISLIAIVVNYTFSFYTRFKTPKLTPVLFLVSLNILLVLFISLIPYFSSFISQ